jgi:hypothetical protein
LDLFLFYKDTRAGGTEFNLPLRNHSSTMEMCDNLYFLTYLARSLSFTTHLKSISVSGLPHFQNFEVTKQTTTTSRAEVPGDVPSRSPHGVFALQSSIDQVSFVLTAKVVQAHLLVTKQFTSTTNFILARATADVLRDSVGDDFTAYITEKTGKPSLPATAQLQLLFPVASEDAVSCKGDDELVNLAECALAQTSSRIFVGFETFQTSGSGFHFCAPFFATMDRESVETEDSPIGDFNRDLFWAGGIVSRIMYGQVRLQHRYTVYTEVPRCHQCTMQATTDKQQTSKLN